MLKRMRGFHQYNQEDCGAACLASILVFFNKYTTISTLRNKMLYDKNGANVLSITEVAREYGIEAEAYEGSYDELLNGLKEEQFKLPMIVHVLKENQETGVAGHFIIIKKINKNKIKVFDPSEGHVTLSDEAFKKVWTGVIICFDKSETENTNPVIGKNFGSYFRYINIILGQKKLFILTVVLSIFISLITFAGTWVYKLIIDDYIMSTDIGDNIGWNFTLLVLGLVIIYFFQSGISFLNSSLIAKISKRISNRLSESFLQHLLNIPEKNLFYFETGEVLSRFQSIVEVQNSYVSIILTLTTEVIGAIIGAIILFNISSQLFIYVLFMVIGYLVIFAIFIPYIKKNSKKYYSYYSESITALNQTIAGNSTILMNKANNWFLDKVSNKVDKSNKKLYSINLLQSALSALIGLIESIGRLTILWKGSQLVIQNSLSLGSLVAFQSMIGNFMLPMQQLILIQNDIQNLKILTQRLNDLYEIDVNVSNLPIKNLEEATNYDIKLLNTSFAYYYGKNVLENINLEIKEGSKVGIIGESGSGKTTLIKLMATLYNPSAGDIMLSHKPYSCYSISNLRSKIAYVDQVPFIIEGTILDNLTMGMHVDEDIIEHIKEIADLCGLYSFDSHKTNDLDMFLYENGNNLSGGQKQKIGLARALVKKPKVLLLDEATSNIDDECKHRLLDYIYSLEGVSVIVISHDSSVYNYSDKIISVKNGNVQFS